MPIDNHPPSQKRPTPDITHLDSSPQSWNLLYSRPNMPICVPGQPPHEDWLFVPQCTPATPVTTTTTNTTSTSSPSVETSSNNGTTPLTSSNINLLNLINSPDPQPRGRNLHRKGNKHRSSARSRPAFTPEGRRDEESAQHMDPWAPASAASYEADVFAVGAWADDKLPLSAPARARLHPPGQRE